MKPVKIHHLLLKCLFQTRKMCSHIFMR